MTTEAFISHDGQYAGFTAGFTNLLSSLFDIPFHVETHDIESLVNGIENKSIDFTGELRAPAFTFKQK
jgi:hypothetical protein